MEVSTLVVKVAKFRPMLRVFEQGWIVAVPHLL
jgi:hypothetical protein